MATPAQHTYAEQIKKSFEKEFKCYGQDTYLESVDVAALEIVLNTKNPLFWIENKASFLNSNPVSKEKIFALVAPAFDADPEPLHGYPALSGSEKQIQFGNSIRQNFLTLYKNVWPQLSAHYIAAASEKSRERWIATMREIDEKLSIIAIKTESKFWIDNKESLTAGWCRAYRLFANSFLEIKT